MDDYNRRNKKREDPDTYFSARPRTKPKLRYSASINDNGRKKPSARAPARRAGLFNRIMKSVDDMRFSNRGFRGSRLPLMIAVIILLIAVLSFSLWFFMRKNAWEVYMGGELIGVIAMDKAVTEQSVHGMAVAKLETEAGTKVNVDEEITFNPVHAAKKDMATLDYVIGAIYKTWPYTVEASVITVNSMETVPLKSDEEASAVLDRIAEQYVNEAADIVDKSFVEKVDIVKKFVEPDAVGTMDSAFLMLSKSTETTAQYEVKSGDNLGSIAAAAGMTLAELLDVNPGVDVGDTLPLGKLLTIVVPKPFLSVITVEKFTYTSVAEKKVETRDNPQQSKNYSKVIQQGRNGQKEVTEHITRINGFETEKKVVDEKIIEDPVTEIVERGTGQGVTAR